MEFRNLKDISGNVLKEKIQEYSIPSEMDINISDICERFEHNVKHNHNVKHFRQLGKNNNMFETFQSELVDVF